MHAQTPDADEDLELCPPNQFELLGARQVKRGVAEQYQISSTQSLSGSYAYTYEVWRDGENVQLSEEQVLNYSFPSSGSTVIKWIATSTGGCVYSLEEKIEVYESIVTYIGPVSPELQLAVSRIGNSQLLVKEITIADTASISEQLLENRYYIQHADKLLLNSSQLGSLLEQLDMLNQFAPIDMTSMDIYAISKVNQSAFRRLAARYHALLNTAEIHVVPSQYISSLISDILLDNNALHQPYIKTFSASLNDGRRYMLLSYGIDYLLFNGFPLSTLTLILLLPFLALLISIFRQVVGFSVFGVFNPLLFAVSLHVLGVTPTIILFVTAFLATAILKLLTQKLYLLYSAKISLLIVIYVVLIIGFFWLDHSYFGQQINFSDFQEIDALFPILFILAVGKQVFSEQFHLFDAGWWIGLLEFFVVSYVIYVAFTTVWLQNLFLGYPELLLLIFVLNIIVGRFSGLQLVEYVRFMPLIKQYLRDEEEE
ncbi:MAG: hypothetical protein H6765_03280 [Candidatus Peribacteria bacterium]|nr:MAG: hypothetical protein H6765_03280 [Candidatus Peribacteria bacterium]